MTNVDQQLPLDVAKWLSELTEAAWSQAFLASTSDPKRALRLAIAALEKAKVGRNDAEKAKLDRFALEVQDVLGRVAADDALRPD